MFQERWVKGPRERGRFLICTVLSTCLYHSIDVQTHLCIYQHSKARGCKPGLAQWLHVMYSVIRSLEAAHRRVTFIYPPPWVFGSMPPDCTEDHVHCLLWSPCKKDSLGIGLSCLRMRNNGARPGEKKQQTILLQLHGHRCRLCAGCSEMRSVCLTHLCGYTQLYETPFFNQCRCCVAFRSTLSLIPHFCNCALLHVSL